LALVAALSVLLAAPPAHAAAPICDELAQTIAAPPQLVPLKAGAILPLECSDSASHSIDVTPPPEPARQLVPLETPDRMLGWSSGLPPCPRHALVPVTWVEESGERPAHTSAVYRPPRG
jgi:hypothetical protein